MPVDARSGAVTQSTERGRYTEYSGLGKMPIEDSGYVSDISVVSAAFAPTDA
jgi:hypothetical protein